jgi:hypothetical protein
MCSCAFSSCIELPRFSFANCHLQSMPIRLSFANCHLRSMTEEALLQSSLEQLRSVVTAMHLLSAAFLLVALLQSGRAERPRSSSRILALMVALLQSALCFLYPAIAALTGRVVLDCRLLMARLLLQSGFFCSKVPNAFETIGPAVVACMNRWQPAALGYTVHAIMVAAGALHVSSAIQVASWTLLHLRRYPREVQR